MRLSHSVGSGMETDFGTSLPSAQPAWGKHQWSLHVQSVGIFTTTQGGHESSLGVSVRRVCTHIRKELWCPIPGAADYRTRRHH